MWMEEKGSISTLNEFLYVMNLELLSLRKKVTAARCV